MNQSGYVLLWIALALIAANLPFLPFGKDQRRFKWRLLELLLGYAVVVGIGLWIESHLGKTTTQGWQFYAITLALYVTFAALGFVWRYLYSRARA